MGKNGKNGIKKQVWTRTRTVNTRLQLQRRKKADNKEFLCEDNVPQSNIIFT